MKELWPCLAAICSTVWPRHSQRWKECRKEMSCGGPISTEKICL